MRIISWNCNMKFREKSKSILTQNPDILIVSECEHPEKLPFLKDLEHTEVHWYGDLQNKGLAVFVFNGFKIKVLPNHNTIFKFILPLQVSKDDHRFLIFAVWAQKPEKHDRYIEQVWDAVEFYSDMFKEDNIVIAGDFNSNSVFDKPKRTRNHSDFVNLLQSKGIRSAYHEFYNEAQGKETRATHFHTKKFERPFHIDYCFLSANLTKKLTKVQVGSFDDWIKISDHKPIVVDLNLE